ncbi:MAG: hypothetical protein KAI47_20675, partial [Deltaproteobacteria bacterium]|nr:hypothetical protein [Deltaproteobacteria bacterium]
MTPRSYPALLILTISFLGIMVLDACKPPTSGTPKKATKVAGAKAQSAGSTGTTSAQGAANPAATNAAVPPSKATKAAKTGAVAAGASA